MTHEEALHLVSREQHMSEEWAALADYLDSEQDEERVQAVRKRMGEHWRSRHANAPTQATAPVAVEAQPEAPAHVEASVQPLPSRSERKAMPVPERREHQPWSMRRWALMGTRAVAAVIALPVLIYATTPAQAQIPPQGSGSSLVLASTVRHTTQHHSPVVHPEVPPVQHTAPAVAPHPVTHAHAAHVALKIASPGNSAPARGTAPVVHAQTKPPASSPAHPAGSTKPASTAPATTPPSPTQPPSIESLSASYIQQHEYTTCVTMPHQTVLSELGLGKPKMVTTCNQYVTLPNGDAYQVPSSLSGPVLQYICSVANIPAGKDGCP